MTLLQPSYLWGLLALSIPIIIHLWSRKKVLTIKVGSTQFISETKSRKSNTIQLNEWWLLVLRCLIISLLVFILAQPRVTSDAVRQDVVYLFEPSLLSTEEGKARFNQIPQEGRRLLTSGFPVWEDGDNINTGDVTPNYWQLAQEMESISADSIVVFTYAFAKAVRGKRPTVQSNINWIPVDLDNPKSQPLVAQIKNDSVAVVSIMSDANAFRFENTKISKERLSFNSNRDRVAIETKQGLQRLPVAVNKPLNVTIIYDEAADEQWDYLAAAFRAIEKYAGREIKLNTIENAEDLALQEIDYLVVLTDRKVTDVTIPALLYQPDGYAKSLIENGNVKNQNVLTKKLNPENIVEEHLVEQLLQWMQLDKETEARGDAYDKRVIALNQLQTNASTKMDTAKKIAVADISGPLWILLLVLLASERILASIRKQ